MREIVTYNRARLLVGAIALLDWFALILQLVSLLQNAHAGGVATLRAVVNYFSFFTILTNILVALSLTCYVLFPKSTVTRFLQRGKVRSALAVYIAVVGAVYMLILRNLWDPEGLQKVVDVILHDVTPVGYVLCWMLFFSKNSVNPKSVPWWLGYPLLYLLYSLVRGEFTDWYPYPFIDAQHIGYARVVLNSTVLVLIFLLLSFASAFFTMWRSRQHSQALIRLPGRQA